MKAVAVCEMYVRRYLTYFQLGIIIDLNTYLSEMNTIMKIYEASQENTRQGGG